MGILKKLFKDDETDIFSTDNVSDTYYNLKPEEVIVLGNNDYEDCWCASEANIKTLLIGDNLIHDKRNTKKFEHLKMDEVIDFLKNVNV